MDKKFNLTPKNLIYLCLIFLIPIVCVTGVSVFPSNIKLPGTIAMGILCLIHTVFIKKKLVLNCITIPAIILCGFLLISSIYSLAPKSALKFCYMYLSSVALLFADLPEKVFSKAITISRIILIIIALSILLSTVIDDFIITYFKWFINPENSSEINFSITNEIKNCNAYSGLAKERGEAAYLMNIGLGIVLADYFAGKKFKIADWLQVFIFVGALYFTNKRMLFVIPIIAFAVMLFLSKIKGKPVKFVMIALVAVGFMIVLSMFIPIENNIFERFSAGDDDFFNGREELWGYSLSMFAEYPIFGRGFASYNNYIYSKGYRYGGGKWVYYGHNCYYQVLGETGVVGAIIFLAVFIIPLVLTVAMLYRRILNKGETTLMMFALYVEILSFVYSISGNVLYYNQQIVMWFFAIAIVLYCKNKYKFTLFNKKYILNHIRSFS